MIRRIYIHQIGRKICIVETYSSGGYGAYHISKFTMRLKKYCKYERRNRTDRCIDLCM